MTTTPIADPTNFPFLVTKEYRRFAEFCDACRRFRYIGLCYGPPGVGKTLSARHYARWALVEESDHLDRRWKRHVLAPLDVALLECRTLIYTPPVSNTPRIIQQAVENLRDTLQHIQFHVFQQEGMNDQDDLEPELVIVDEADRLKLPGLEQLRDMYDRGRLGGLVLIGMPGIEKRLARYAQLYSRVGFVHPYRPLGKEELQFVLEQRWQDLGLRMDPGDFTDAEAIAAVIRITSGNFRLLQRLFSQIERILEINGLRLITKEVVEAARESLVIGVG